MAGDPVTEVDMCELSSLRKRVHSDIDLSTDEPSSEADDSRVGRPGGPRKGTKWSVPGASSLPRLLHGTSSQAPRAVHSCLPATAPSAPRRSR